MNESLPDRENLLFGIFAWRLGYIDQLQLSAAMRRCQEDDAPPLSDVLVELGFISEDSRRHLQRLMDDQLRHHGGDAEQSLASLNCPEEMLSTLAGASGDTDRPARPDAVPPQEQLGQTLSVTGQVRLLELHAQGGLGRVYRAADESLGREVAFKEVRADVPAESEAEARFLREAQICGRLQHPNIVPVYSIGTRSDGRAFYTMRMVEGRTLSYSIRELHDNSTGVDYNSTEFRSLVDRLIDVAQAVSYAHNQGVLHRDLKPENILVGAFGETLVIDWGLARQEQHSPVVSSQDEASHETETSDDNQATRQGQVLGTIGYAPPEQLNGRVDLITERSDVYALGAILYQLLVGKSPVKTKSSDGNLSQLIQIAVEGEFRAPRTVKPAVPKSLSAICMKALAREPEGRYPSTRVFLEELERWKADQPVEAIADSLADRVVRSARKHRGATLSAVTTLLAITIVSAGAFVLVNSARTRESRERQRATVLAEEKTRLADRNQQVVDAFVDAFRSPDPANEGVTGKMTALEVLERALERLESDDEWQQDRLTRSALLEAIGRSLKGMGSYDRAATALEASFRETEAELGSTDQVTISRMPALCGAYLLAGRLEEAIDMGGRAVEACRAELGSDHPTTLVAMTNLGEAYRRAGRLKDAIPLLQDMAGRSLAGDESDPSDRVARMGNLANVYFSNGQYEEAIEQYKKTLQQAQATFGSDHPSILTTKNNLASVYQEMRRFDEAIAAYEEVLTELQDKMGPEHPNTLSTISNLANALSSAGRVQESFPLYEQALAGMKTKLGEDHPLTLGTMNNYAFTYRNAGDVPKALEIFSEVLEQMNTSLGPSHPSTLIIMLNVADAKQTLGQRQEAADLLEIVYERNSNTLGEDHPSTLRAGARLANLLGKLGRVNQATSLHETVLARMESRYGPDHAQTLTEMTNLIQCYLASGQLAKAEPLLADARQRTRDQLGVDHLITRKALLLSSQLALQAGQHVEARAFSQQYLNSAPSDSDGSVVDARLAFAEACLRLRAANVASEAARTVLSADPLTNWQRARAEHVLAAGMVAEQLEQARDALVSSTESLIDALPEASPQDYWYVEFACQRVIDFLQAAEDTEAVTSWQAKRDTVHDAIQHLCYGNESTEAKEPAP